MPFTLCIVNQLLIRLWLTLCLLYFLEYLTVRRSWLISLFVSFVNRSVPRSMHMSRVRRCRSLPSIATVVSKQQRQRGRSLPPSSARWFSLNSLCAMFYCSALCIFILICFRCHFLYYNLLLDFTHSLPPSLFLSCSTVHSQTPQYYHYYKHFRAVPTINMSRLSNINIRVGIVQSVNAGNMFSFVLIAIVSLHAMEYIITTYYQSSALSNSVKASSYSEL